MKTVLVFDTDDPKGMQSTIKIVEHLAQEYAKRAPRGNSLSFGKIEFIKTLRSFMTEAATLNDLTEAASLRFAKRFSDKVWSEKEKGMPFRP
jgi:hypothetical protein